MGLSAQKRSQKLSEVLLPRDDKELQAQLEKLPIQLRAAVTLWCRGLDPEALQSLVSPRGLSELKNLGYDLTIPHPAPFDPPPQPVSKHYLIRVVGADDVPFHVHALRENSDLMLSPRGRLAGWEKAAMLDSETLAQALIAHCLPRMRKRYGAELDLVISAQTQTPHPRTERRIKEDSEAATAYLGRNEKRN